MRVYVLSLVVSSALAFYHAQPPRRSLGRVWATSTRIEPREIAMPADPTDPFLLVRQDLKRMKRRIKELVEGTLDDSSSSSHPLLQEAAREFFERRERAFRPTIVILAARALQALKRSPPAVFKLQCQLAEIVEMMSTAQARAAPRHARARAHTPEIVIFLITTPPRPLGDP